MFDYRNKWKLNPQSTVSYMKQLENNIRWSISAGDIAREERLPTIRTLAYELNISTNTVRSVYKKLEKEGYVVTRPHYGTVVLSSTENVEDCTKEFTLSIKNVLRSALTKEEVREIFERVYAEYMLEEERKPVLFVETSRVIIDQLGEQIYNETGYPVQGMLLDEFEDYIKTNSEDLEQYSAIVTTYFYYSTIRKMKGIYTPMVCGMVQDIRETAITALHNLPLKAKVGIVCRKNDAVLAVRNLVLSVRSDLDLSVYFDDFVDQGIADNELIICASPATTKIACEMVKDIPVYEFLDGINSQSMNMLKEFLK